MIQDAGSNDLQGNAEIQNFNIELNSTMFDMIVSKVYTDKIMAVVREWSTNAIDACIDANKPIQFEAHLPTILEPWFAVRDYGTGLSDKDVLGLYSTLGASTKRESNDFNGTFGIGRGAGLAYSTRFQVDSYFEGTKISYLVSTDNGIPAMISLGQEPTDEPNGLNVQVNVQSKDTEKFIKTAKDVYMYFDHKPITNLKIEYPEVIKTIEGKDWYIEESNYGKRYNNVPLVIMGNVAYQVAREHFGYDVSILHTSLRLRVPLGAVSITPGRESLSMDEKTIAYLKRRFTMAGEEVTASLLKTLDKCNTTWEKVVKFNSAVASLPHQLRKTVEWLPDDSGRFVGGRYGDKTIHIERGGDDELNGIQMSVYHQDRVAGQELGGPMLSRISVTPEVKFMVSDERQGFIDAAKAYRDSFNARTTVVLIKMVKFNTDNLKKFLKDVKVVLKELGEPEHVMASDWVVARKKSIAAGRTITATDFAPLSFHRGFDTSNVVWSRGNMLSTYTAKQFFYVEMLGYELANLTQQQVNGYFNYLQIYKDKFPADNFAIVGVPKGAMSNIKYDPRFIPLKKAAEDRQGKTAIVDFTAVDALGSVFRSFNEDRFLELAERLENKEVSMDIKSIMKFKAEHDKASNRGSTKGITKVLKVRQASPSLHKEVEDTLAQYPLIHKLQSCYCKDKVQDIARYMGLEDCSRELVQSKGE